MVLNIAFLSAHLDLADRHKLIVKVFRMMEQATLVFLACILFGTQLFDIWARGNRRVCQFLSSRILVLIIERVENVCLALLLKLLSFCMTIMNKMFTVDVWKT